MRTPVINYTKTDGIIDIPSLDGDKQVRVHASGKVGTTMQQRYPLCFEPINIHTKQLK